MSVNWNLIGHEWAVKLLKSQIRNDNLRHAYLFTGPDGVGRRTLALRLAQAANCSQPPVPGGFCGDCRNCHGFGNMQHTDLYIVERQPGDREIKIDAMRELSRSLALMPYEAKFQVALLLDFNLASEEAANALLKTLEEPNPSVLLFLTAPDADSLPATIVSRCEVLPLRPVPVDELASDLSERFGIGPDKTRLPAGVSGGRPGLAIQLHKEHDLLEQRGEWLEEIHQVLSASKVERFAYADKVSKDKDVMRKLLLAWLSFWRDVMHRSVKAGAELSNPDHKTQIDGLTKQLSFEDAYGVVKEVEHALEQLNTNINARLAMEAFLLQIPRLS